MTMAATALPSLTRSSPNAGMDRRAATAIRNILIANGSIGRPLAFLSKLSGDSPKAIEIFCYVFRLTCGEGITIEATGCLSC